MRRYVIALALPLLLLAPVAAEAMKAAPHRTVCTMEAKICPDGSSVARTGPNCEFSPCPGETGTAPVSPPSGIACPMFRRLCPDGSSVGPTGPHCEVPTCPGETAPQPPQAAPGGAPGSVPGSSGDGDNEDDDNGSGVISSPPSTGGPALPDLPLEGSSPQPASVKFVLEHRGALDGQSVTVHGIVVDAILARKPCPAGGCPPSFLTLADTADTDRNKSYDMQVALPNGDARYALGQIVDVSGIVAVSGGGVTLQKQ